MDRRRFLASLVALAAAGAVGAPACGDDGGDDGAGGTQSTTTDPSEAPLPSLAEALATLGAAVRRDAPGLEPLDLPVAVDDQEALAAAVAALDAAACADLASGDAVRVAGWELSVTEARLCLAAS